MNSCNKFDQIYSYSSISPFQSLSKISQGRFIMLLKSKNTVKLAKRYQKILFLSTALKDTFVFLGMPGVGRQSIVHVDKNGKILFQEGFTCEVDSFAMLSEREAVVLETRNNKIAVLDLQSHLFTRFDHQFIREESDLVDIETFYQTRMLCVKESGMYNDSRFVLTYYSYPLGGKHIARYESTDNQWTHEYISRKANNHSMIAWFRPRNDQEIQLKTFDLRDKPEGAYNCYRIRNTIGQPYHLNKVELAISNIWETKRNVFCAVCVTNKTESNAVDKDGKINNNFIIDTVTSTVREANYTFASQYNDYLIDYVYLGPIAMFRTFSFENGKVKPTPVYYVNNETEKIVAQDKWECTYRTKYYVPGFDSCTLIEGQYENGDVDEFTISVQKILDPREIALHFLLHVNEDFDDDLLQDAIEMLYSGES